MIVFLQLSYDSEQNSTSSTPTPELRRRKKTTNMMTNDVKERRKTVASNQSLSLMPDKDKERRKTVNMKVLRHLQILFLSICILFKFTDCNLFHKYT